MSATPASRCTSPMHFDGWGPFDNPRGFSTRRGLHAQFEGAFVKTNVRREAVKAAIGALSRLRLLDRGRACAP